MQARLGADLSDVRLHTGGDARASAAAVGARAYTSGSHVVIGVGGTDKRTLAHELTHVIQQRQGTVTGTDLGNGLKVSDPHDTYERAAEANATRVMRARVRPRDSSADTQDRRHTPGPSDGERTPVHDRAHALPQPSGPVIQRDFLEEAKIGLELTFENAFTRDHVKNDGFTGISAAAGANWWEKEVAEPWARRVGDDGPSGETVKVDKPEKNKDFGNGTGELWKYRFNYAQSDLIPDFPGWWWQLSLDPGVVEIQTAKAPAESFNPTPDAEGSHHPIHDIVQDHIFHIAINKMGFTAGGGGGHVNVDLESGFGGDYSLIPLILWATESVIDGLRRRNVDDPERALVELSNEGSDPFLSTDRRPLEVGGPAHAPIVKEKEKSKPGDLSGHWESQMLKAASPKSAKDWNRFREAHATWLWSHPSETQQLKKGRADQQFGDRLDEDTVKRVLHYQAINIEHLSDEDEESRRLEFRFFKGQENTKQIYESAKLIERIKKEAERIKREAEKK